MLAKQIFGASDIWRHLTITTICSNGDSLPLVLPLRLAPAILFTVA